MDALLDEWAEWMRASGAADRTISTRLQGIRTLCSFADTKDPVSLTTRQLISWLAACRSAWTRCTYASSARAWHRWLVDRGYRLDNPMSAVPVPKQPRGVPRPATTSDLKQVLETAPRIARAYITLGAFEGLRVHEIAKVDGDHFDGEGWMYVDGKGGELAAIPVHPLVDQLRRGFPEHGLWFPGSVDGHVSPNSVTKSIGRTFQRRGMHVTAHQLRHWFGTHTQRISKDSRVTQQLMRHASLDSTQIYTQVADLSKVEAVRRLAAS